MKCASRVRKGSLRGFCAGAIRAIETLHAILQGDGRLTYARHAIGHNPAVVGLFEQNGVGFVEELDAHGGPAG